MPLRQVTRLPTGTAGPLCYTPPMPMFTAATFTPLALLALGATLGGPWPWLALAAMALAPIALDTMIPHTTTDYEAEFPAADALLIILGLAGLASLPLLTHAIAGPSGLSLPARLALLLAGGLWLGQVGHPAAHELIHRPRPLFSLGLALYTALLFGHHTSAHRLVHHRHVATKDDPNTARKGESFYRFLPRAWKGSFLAGYRAETALRARATSRSLHPYAVYIGGALLSLTLATLIAGLPGLLVWLTLGLHAGSQILLSDYVQHYGLTRPADPTGKPSPVTPAQSWNTPHWFTSALLLNAPRHSDHHVNPTRPYPNLRLPPEAPILPWPLPLAALIALYPRAWHRRMAPLLAQLDAR